MNILIISGLFGIAILAIIGIILLSLSERTAQASQATTIKPVAPPTPEQEYRQSAKPTSNLVTGKLAPREPAAPPKSEAAVDTLDGLEASSLVPALNGQFNEFVAELRDLHRQAWELEQRLSVLTELVERAQSNVMNHVSIEEEEPVTVADGQV